MGAIDMHTHAFPDELSERAIKKLEEMASWTACGGGKVSDLIASMDRADIDLSVVCTIATKPEQVPGIFKWCKQIRSPRIEPFPSIHPETKRPGKWLKEFAKSGFTGIKLHPMYQDFEVDDPRMDGIYQAASDCEIVIAVHAGRDIAFPPDDDRASPRRIRRVIDRFSKLKLLCTHLGGWKDWDAVEQHLVGTDVYMETSFSTKFLGQERAAELISRHGVERVMFGTDWPWMNQSEEIARIKSLGLSESDKRTLLFANSAKLLGY